MTRRRLRSTGACLLTATTALAGLAACSTHAPSGFAAPAVPNRTAIAGPSSAPAGAPSASAPPAPLTGRPSRATGATIVVPIEVRPGGPVPVGLDAADIVAVEYGESGLIRAVGAYQSRDAAKVGPVGAVRPSDLKLESQLKPLYAQSGTTDGVLSTAATVGLALRDAAKGGAGFTTVDRHRYVNTAALRTAGATGLAAPGSLFQYAAANTPVAPSGVAAAHRVTIAYTGHPTMTWQYDETAKVWRSTLAGAPVSTANLVLIRTPYLTKSVHSLGRDLTYADPMGSGAAIVVAGDQRIAASWSKRGFSSALNMLGPGQDVPLLVPGTSWVYLLPARATVTAS
jgi:Protein of unknown function (DUF3048) N-terminal domain/Protein of unknown function (DUF3048) C-terminal domain